LKPAVRVGVVALLLAQSTLHAQHNLEEARKAWPDLQLFEPKRLRALGPQLQADLQERGCRIPIFTKWDGRHNVIRGSFTGPGKEDVAVLCLSGDDMSIVIYPGGKPEGAAEIHRYPADAYRMIHAVSPFVLRKKAIRDNVVDKMPDFDHDAIEDGPVGERSETAYFNGSKWMTVF
jgi:hypothetical protein